MRGRPVEHTAEVKHVGPYRLLDEVARGGIGVVYRGLDPRGGPVAIKLLLDPTPDPRVEQEARALRSLRHPAIVGFRDQLLDARGRQVLVMDWIQGESLAARLKQGLLPVDEAIRLTTTLCGALEHAHQRGVLHRDLKPDNVMVTPAGAPVLTDFGLGKVVDLIRRASQASLTEDGDVLGTPGYMPPEQAR